MSPESNLKILAHARVFLDALSAIENMHLDADLYASAIKEVGQMYLKKGGPDLFPGIDELVIGEITLRTPDYDVHQVHHSHTLAQIKSWVEQNKPK